MKNRILWIDDDYESIQGLFFPLKKAGFTVDYALSALDGYRKALQWQIYDLLVIDLILPLTTKQETIPDIVKGWGNIKVNAQVGIGMAQWLRNDLGATCPIIILSIVNDPINQFKLGHLNLQGYVPKVGLLPSALKEKIINIISETQ